MASVTEDHQRRYRRRIAGLGAILFVLCFLIPAPFVIDGVEDDLEGRVTDELDDAGIDGVEVRFSGQDGTLDCAGPLDDPDAVAELAADEWGVRVIELGDGCRAESVDPADDADSTTTDDAAGDDDLVNATAVASSTTTVAATTTTEAVEAARESLATLIADDPQFSQLAGLIASSGLGATLGGSEELTVLAPTDEAFDAAFDRLGPDAFAQLAGDPDLIESVLLRHVTAGALGSGDLVEATEVEMFDGSVVVARTDGNGVELTVDGASATLDTAQSDVDASNGVLHPIDMVLLPSDLDLGVVEVVDPDVTVELDGGRVRLVGTVASASQRIALLDALAAVVDPANVVDELAVDDTAAVLDVDVERLAAIVAAMPPNLASGTATAVGPEINVAGLHLGDAPLAVIEAVAEAQGATLELTARPDADADAAGALEDDLNEIVRTDPITFEPNSASITDDAAAVIDRIAATAQRLGATDILVVGHTDSDGLAATNQQLSEARAAAVVDALIARGVDGSTLSSEGRGRTEPILVDGVEDKDASRRVEFAVTTTG